MDENIATPQLDPERFKLQEFESNDYVVTIESGITREQLLDPAFFAHVAAKLRPYNEIRVRCDDGTIYARLLILTCDRTWARCRVLEWHDLTSRDVAQTQATAVESPAVADADPANRFRIENKGPHVKWRIVRIADNAVVREKEETKAAAQAWLNDYLRVITT